jgi:hypothetical protein
MHAELLVGAAGQVAANMYGHSMTTVRLALVEY